MSSGQLFYLGPEGTFAHAAALSARARTYAGCELKASSSIVSVFEEVVARADAFGVVPIENSTEGSVSFTLDALLDFEELRIVGEVVLEVEQCLLGAGKMHEVKRVLSHPHGLAQCKRWLRNHVPDAELVPTSSTAAAAMEVRGKRDSAAIAGELAGTLAGLHLLERGIQDRHQNSTRFVVLGRQEPAPTAKDKTSIVFRTPHERGALCRVLGVLDQANINLSRIQSRPMPGELWQYIFFADLEGHSSEPRIRGAFEAIRSSGHELRVFGSYPAD